MKVEGWDGLNPPDYVSPVKPGQQIWLNKGGTVIIGTVVRTEGYAPDVVELEGGVTVDLVGVNLWLLAEPQAPEPEGG